MRIISSITGLIHATTILILGIAFIIGWQPNLKIIGAALIATGLRISADVICIYMLRTHMEERTHMHWGH
jgi:hypothetical protein